MKRAFLFLAFLVTLSGISWSQTIEQMKEYFDEGSFFFNRGDYEDALFYYLKLTAADSLNPHFNFLVGESYLNIPGKEHLAVPYLEKSVKQIVSKRAYHQRNFYEESAPLHAWFYLGNAYRMDNQLDKALESYMTFIDNPNFHNNYNENVVDNEIKSCERAKIIQDAPIDYELENLGAAINSQFSEEKPVLSPDGNSLVFIRRLQFYDAIFYTTKVDGVWAKAVNINPQLLSDGQFYPTGLSSDGTQMLLVKQEDESTDIYTATYDGSVWSVAKKMESRINSFDEELHASFGPNDESILLTSNRRGGKGGFDLWIAEKNEDGSWGKPKNMGKEINTELDEITAYLSADDNTLFFSSQGHYTMGGFDIFYSTKIGKKWRVPINIGYPINNTRDNSYYCPSSQNNREAIISLSKKEGYGAADLYRVKIKTKSTLSALHLLDVNY